MECFPLFTPPFPEVKVCVFYMRASCLLSQQRRKEIIFVVIRTFLLTRSVCFSYDDDDSNEQTCAETCANEPSRFTRKP